MSADILSDKHNLKFKLKYTQWYSGFNVKIYNIY